MNWFGNFFGRWFGTWFSGSARTPVLRADCSVSRATESTGAVTAFETTLSGRGWAQATWAVATALHSFGFASHDTRFGTATSDTRLS
jgi:hypothetical protein